MKGENGEGEEGGTVKGTVMVMTINKKTMVATKQREELKWGEVTTVATKH